MDANIDSERLRLLRILVAVVFAVICFDWSSSWLAERTLGDVIYNPRPPSLLLLVLFAGGFPALIMRSRMITNNPAAAFGCALVIGGVVANMLSRFLFGPVYDFIPMSIIINHYECDPADLATWIGGIVCFGGFAATRIRGWHAYFHGRTHMRTPEIAAPSTVKSGYWGT